MLLVGARVAKRGVDSCRRATRGNPWPRSRVVTIMRSFSTSLVLVALLACADGAHGEAAPRATWSAVGADGAGTLRAVHLVSRIGSGTADATPKRARAGDGVTLYAVLEIE